MGKLDAPKDCRQTFAVELATLSGSVFHKSWRKFDELIPEGLSYDLEIECEEKTVEIEGDEEEWQPQLRFERFAMAPAAWPEIESLTLEGIAGVGFLDYHNLAGAHRIAFGNRSGHKFSTRIEGKCCGVPFTFSGPVTFNGYRVVGTARDTDETLTAMLEEHVDLFGLEAEDSVLDKSNPRKKMRSKVFVPAKRLPKRSE